jgi:pimeloyl-ACP methyl ester carboxylesterase
MPVAEGLYYHLHPSGQAGALPVLLLHGAGGMHLSWPPEIRRLAGCDVYALDLPGHGKSDAIGGLQTITAYSESVLAWMQASGLAKAVVVGHSMGGAIALTLALQAPEKVLGLGLVATAARLRVNPDLLANAASATTFYKVVDQLSAWSFGPAAPARLVEMFRQRLGEVRPSVLYGDFLACSSFDISDQVSRITCPALVLCGADDRMIPQRHSQSLADLMPGAQFVHFPQVGHMLMLEEPRAAAEALAVFLQSIH